MLWARQWRLPRVFDAHYRARKVFSAAAGPWPASEIPPVCTSFIDNEFVPVRVSPGEDNELGFVNRSPRSGKPLCHLQIPSQEEVDSAVVSSNNAFKDPSWAVLSSAERGHILNDMAARLQQHHDDLVTLEALDTGIPISQVRVNHIPYAIQSLEYYASLALSGSLAGRALDTTPDSFSYTRREPLGVCAAIGTWNYPLVSMVWKLAPALACGNAILYKPGYAPLTALYAAGLWRNLLPPGILQVLLGEKETAQLLVQHEDVQKVSVTGSIETGISVAQAGAATLKRTTLELGGKSPLLVFADADMDSAVRVATEGNFINNGQVCSNCTRVYVERAILDEFISRVVSRVKESVVMGDNMQDDVNMGPLIMPPRHASRHYDHVMQYVDEAKSDSRVELLYGGTGYTDGGGYFVVPTIFLSESDDVRIVQEEVFGPVMTILAFDTEEEAIMRANNTQYGLAAGLMTKDVMRAHRVTKQLAAGNVWVNNFNIAPVEFPFGPYKMSGYGNELGTEAMDSYSQIKTVFMQTSNVEEDSTFFKLR